MLTTTRHKLLGALCVAVWCGLIVVGLWPFNFSPQNHVQWLSDRNGIHFAPEGQIYSEVPLNIGGNAAGQPHLTDGSFSIELRLQPSAVCDCLSTIFSIYDPATAENFRLEQSIGDLVVRGRFRDSSKVKFRSFYVPDVFRKGQERDITLTSGPDGTAIYLEGAPVKFLPARLQADNLSGRLLVGHSAAENKPWRGSLLGMAIYNQTLPSDEVLQHFSAWRDGKAADLKTAAGIAALYPLDEHQGELIHNRARSGPSMVIPRKFYLLKKTTLELPLQFHRSDIKDAIINILGFVPFGFLVAMYLTCATPAPKSRVILLAIILGGLTSLLIELTQVYLPSRDSSSLDVLNNVLGTALGTLGLPLGLKARSIFLPHK